jgi:ferredoxin
MKILVMKGKCVGHARCAAVAPELFELDENGYIAFEERPISPEQEALARRGARACPEAALKVVAEEGE